MSVIGKIKWLFREKVKWKMFHKVTVLQGDERKKYLEYMAYSCIEEYKKANNGKGPSITYMNCAMFLLSKNLKSKGLDVRLPYFWFINGVEVMWEEFTDKVVDLRTKVPITSPA